MQSRALTLPASAVALLLAVSTAAAAPSIDGVPLNVFSEDSAGGPGPGGLQARFDGEAAGEFADPAVDATPAGFHVALYDTPSPGQATLYGPRDGAALPGSTAFTPVGPTTLSGLGTTASPYRLTTAFSAGGLLDITQELSYVNGDVGFLVREIVENPAGGPSSIRFRPTMAGDLFSPGDDRQYGIFESGPPRFVGAVNDFVGSGGGLQDFMGPLFTTYEENDAATIWSKLQDPNGPGFSNTLNLALVNAGVGVQWADTTLGDGASETFTATWLVGGFEGLTMTPVGQTATPGTNVSLDALVRNRNKAVAGSPVRFTVTGANDTSGVATTDTNGIAKVSWFGQHAGTDRVTAFADMDGNGVRDRREVERTAVVRWRLPRPVFGRTANIRPVSGDVTVDPPNGVPFALTDPRQVPVNSVVNATAGVARLGTARSRSGQIQPAKFFRGAFKVVQKRRGNRRKVTDIILVGGKRVRCRPRGRGADAAVIVRRRRLWGSGRGRYRTRGRNSATTVRGTRWLTYDRCDGTYTKVRRGVVVVRDFKKKKNIVVKRGRSYLARP